MVLGSLGLARILLRGIIHVGDTKTAEQRVVVERHLCVERKHAVVLGHDQRIDLEHDGIKVAKRPIGVHDRRDRPLHQPDVEAELKGKLAGLERLEAHRGLDDHLQDGFRLGFGDLLDLHAAAPRGNHTDALSLAIEHVAEIELPVEGLRHLDIDALHRLAIWPGLDGDKALAEELLAAWRTSL